MIVRVAENGWTTDNLTKNTRLFICDNTEKDRNAPMTLRVFIANNITAQLTDDQKHRDLIDQSGQ